MAAIPVPPYKVVCTATMSKEDILQADVEYYTATGLYPDSDESVLVTRSLRRIYKDRQFIDIDADRSDELLTSRSVYRSVIFTSADFWAGRDRLAGIIDSACEQEPYAMWQFVLSIDKEFPLDLIEFIVGVIKKHGTVLADRMSAERDLHRMVSKRLYLLIAKNAEISRSWACEAGDMLAAVFR